MNTLPPAIESVIARLTPCPHFREDLRQEARLFLWQHRISSPDSYHTQSCRFHLQHVLAAGRSIDSAKRAAGNIASETTEEPFDAPAEETDLAGLIDATQLARLISTRLTPRAAEVFSLLLDGYGITEVGRLLGISHVAVLKHRKQIQQAYETLH